MTESDLPAVKEVVEKTLRERCGNVFELIAVRPDFNEYGDEILIIKAVFNLDRLGVRRTSGPDTSPARQTGGGGHGSVPGHLVHRQIRTAGPGP